MKNFDSPFETSTKPSSMLNVLCILTIIWSVISLLQSAYTFFSIEKSYVEMKKLLDSNGLSKSPDFVKNLINEDTVLQLESAVQYKLPIFILGIIGALLCIFGAIEMRKLKSHGYFYWLCGEVLPILSAIIFIGLNSFAGLGLLGLFFPLLFIVLYSVYKKELTN